MFLSPFCLETCNRISLDTNLREIRLEVPEKLNFSKLNVICGKIEEVKKFSLDLRYPSFSRFECFIMFRSIFLQNMAILFNRIVPVGGFERKKVEIFTEILHGSSNLWSSSSSSFYVLSNLWSLMTKWRTKTAFLSFLLRRVIFDLLSPFCGDFLSDTFLCDT
jgi:hypothetical protein